jgi:hypothetical protein
MKAFMPFLFIPVFLLWVLYRALVKKDIKNHIQEVTLGSLFVVIWVTLYMWMINVR